MCVCVCVCFGLRVCFCCLCVDGCTGEENGECFLVVGIVCVCLRKVVGFRFLTGWKKSSIAQTSKQINVYVLRMCVRCLCLCSSKQANPDRKIVIERTNERDGL